MFLIVIFLLLVFSIFAYKKFTNKIILKTTISSKSAHNDIPSSSYVTSKDNNITLYDIQNNLKLPNNFTLNGSTNYSRLNYYVYDSITGLIGQGTIRVIDGKFSDIIRYNSISKSNGILEIYYSNPLNGSIESMVTVDVEINN